jgi:hypothetical protein
MHGMPTSNSRVYKGAGQGFRPPHPPKKCFSWMRSRDQLVAALAWIRTMSWFPFHCTLLSQSPGLIFDTRSPFPARIVNQLFKSIVLEQK